MKLKREVTIAGITSRLVLSEQERKMLTAAAAILDVIEAYNPQGRHEAEKASMHINELLESAKLLEVSFQEHHA